MQLTANDLDRRVLARVDGNELLYPQVERYRYVNEAIRSINLLTGFQQASLLLPYYSQSNRVWYDVPQRIIFPLRVQFENTYLQPSSMLNIGRSIPRWTSETTGNTGQQVSSWVRFGIRKFGLHPADSAGGYAITVTGVVEPPLMVNPTDKIQFSNDILSAFDLYCSSAITLKESTKEFAMQSQDYQKYLSLMKKLTMWKGLVAPRYFISEVSQPLSR